MTPINNGIMEVTVVGAKNLKNTDLFGKLDPYVVLHYKRSQQHKSTTGQGTSPLWNEKFKFRVEYEPQSDDKKKYKLLLELMDRDSFTNDDYLGQVTIYLNELFERGVENGKSELPTQKYRVVDADKTYRGEIEVGITFTTKEGTDEQKYGGWKESK